MTKTLRKETKVAMALRDDADIHKAQLDNVEDTGVPEPAAHPATEEPRILDEICVEELAIDGICGVY